MVLHNQFFIHLNFLMIMETLTKQQMSVVAEVKLSYHPKINPSQRPKITTAIEAYRLFLQHWDLDKIYLSEQCYMLLLNVRGNALGMIQLSSGGINSTVLDLKMIFATALKACASAIILAHNHPSGEVSPSQEDIRITKRIEEAGKILGIELADHLIITPTKFLSMGSEGYL
jgi:DNA repair protein RadC